MTIQAADPFAPDTDLRAERDKAAALDRHLAADLAERLGLREDPIEGGQRWAGTVSGAPVQIVTH